MLRFGNITEVDFDKCYARVTFTDDGIVSDWLQILVRSAIQDSDSFTFDTNEQVACMMDENSEQGVILGAIFNDKNNPKGGGKGITKFTFSDNSSISYDRNTHKYAINVIGTVSVNALSVDITSPDVSMSGNLTVVGTVTAAVLTAPSIVSGTMAVAGGNITADSVTSPIITTGVVSLAAHKHLGVTSGTDISGTPTP